MESPITFTLVAVPGSVSDDDDKAIFKEQNGGSAAHTLFGGFCFLARRKPEMCRSVCTGLKGLPKSQELQHHCMHRYATA